MPDLPSPDASLPGTARAQRVLAVLPAYNESENIAGVIADIRENAAGTDVLVVDDGSRDDTVTIARSLGVSVLEMPFNVGVGGAVRAGLEYGRRAGYDVVLQCDSDGQHPASEIGALVAGLASADVVIGARFAGKGDYEMRGPRKWAASFLAATMSRIHRTSLTDVTSGFRAFGPVAIDVLSRQMPQEYLGDTVEALVISRETGLTVRQIPVQMRERQGGVPSHNPRKAAIFLARALLIFGLSAARLVKPLPSRAAQQWKDGDPQ